MRGMQIAPARVDGLHGMDVVALAAGKFHSAALARDGTLFTWGFGRGGRLGAFYAISATLMRLLCRMGQLCGMAWGFNDTSVRLARRLTRAAALRRAPGV